MEPQGFGAQGWLKKKGNKRWFVLKGNVLYWFKKEQKNVSIDHKNIAGCMELPGTTIAEDSQSKSITLSKMSTMTRYVLLAPDIATMKYWTKALNNSISPTESSNREIPTNSDVTIQAPDKRGILKKKGKERLFVLKSDCLIWFLVGQTGETKAKGSLYLNGISLGRGTKPYSFLLTPIVGGKYELIAKNQKECDEWMSAISNVLLKLVEDSQLEDYKSGWLEKKGLKRWFLVKKGKLVWFNRAVKDESSPKANGYLLLSDCKVSKLPPLTAQGKYPFSLLCIKPQRREYTLMATSSSDCADWVNAIIRAGASGERELPTTETNTVHSATGNNSDSLLTTAGSYESASSLNSGNSFSSSSLLNETHIGDFDEDYGQPPSEAGSVKMNFLEQNTATSDVDVKSKSGWLMKKGKKRWFVAEDGCLNWYTQPKFQQNKAPPNGSLNLSRSRVAFGGEAASGYSSFSINSLVDEQSNQSVEYLLHAYSKEECEDWVLILKKLGAKGFMNTSSEQVADRRKSVAETKRNTLVSSSTTLINDKNGWLEKKGKQRWFLLNSNKLSWFNRISDDTSLTNGILYCPDCTVEKIVGMNLKKKYGFSVEEKPGNGKKRSFVFYHIDENEINSWVAALIEKGGAARKGPERTSLTLPDYNVPTPSPNTAKVFGGNLQMILEASGRNGMLPIVVEDCVLWIKKLNGVTTEGIFRLSGDSSDVSFLKSEFEKGKVEFDENMDVHTIAGVLKAFLREMEPPLITYELYDEFCSLAKTELDVIRAHIQKLPKDHQRLLKFLMLFLHEVSQCSSENKMEPMNLAIVFGPNIFRSTNPMAILSDSALVGTLTQKIIVNAHEIFQDDNQEEIDKENEEETESQEIEHKGTENQVTEELGD